MYYLRVDKGSLFGQVSNDVALKMIRSINGFHRPYRVEGKPEKICYEFSEDAVFGMDQRSEVNFSFFIFKGYLLIPQ